MSPLRQAQLHIALLLLALLFLPITPRFLQLYRAGGDPASSIRATRST